MKIEKYFIMEQDAVISVYEHLIVTKNLTFLATMSTTSRATIKQPAAILADKIFVEASIKAIPQNDEPRSGFEKPAQNHKYY